MRKHKRISIRVYEDQIDTPLEQVDSALVMERFMTFEGDSTSEVTAPKRGEVTAPPKGKVDRALLEKSRTDTTSKPHRKVQGDSSSGAGKKLDDYLGGK